MRPQPLAFPPLPLAPPLPSSSSSSSSSSFPSSRPAMGLFHPSPPTVHHPPPSSARSAAAAPPPSRAAAILASQAIKKDAGGSVAAAASTAGSGTGAATSLTSTAGSSRRTLAAAKDNKRRATHSQIERRRREKINDRLITLRNLVPACNEEIAARQGFEGGQGEQPAHASSPTEGGAEETGSGTGTGAKRKRKRTRRKVVEELKDKDKDKDAEPELGMHKLDVLTHTIEFIYQLQARIQDLETGRRPVEAQRAERDDTVEEATRSNTSPPLLPPPGLHNAPPALPPIDEKPPRGFTPIKLGGTYRRDLGHMRSMSASSETTSEADLPLPHQLPTPGYGHGYGYGSASGYGYGYGHGYGYGYDSSPSFTTGASSSSSKGANTPASSGGLSSLTSPFMSLSASSPIFLAGTGSGGSGGAASGGGKKGLFDTRGAAPSFALPPAALSLYEVAHPHHHPQHHSEIRGQHGSTSSVRDGGSQEEEGREDEDQEMATGEQSNGSNGSNVSKAMGRSPVPEPEASSAARLLLAMSASPEDALRPIGGSHFDPRTIGTTGAPRSMPRMRRSSTTSSHADRPEMGRGLGPGPSGVFFAHKASSSANGAPMAAHNHTQYRRWVPGSAPGGSRATTATGGPTGRMGSLPSPPLLALDDQAVQEQ